MYNKKYYPFKRNNYFFGKLMTVQDFEDEQRYNNDKRRLANRVLHGAGIVSGLDCILIDDQTISLEPGVAIDYGGREIVVEEPVVKKLGVISGFEDIKDKEECYLCLRYKEQLKEASFSAMERGESAEQYNHVSEGYELFFAHHRPDEESLGNASLTTVRRTVYHSEQLHIELSAPRFISPGGRFNVQLHFEKTNLPSMVNFRFCLSDPLLKTAAGGAALEISFVESEAATNISHSQSYAMLCDAVGDAYAPFTLKAADFELKIGGQSYAIDKDMSMNLTVTDTPLREKVVQTYYGRHFDEIIAAGEEQIIYLAKMHIISKQSSYFADGFVKHPFKQYLYSTELLGALAGLESAAGQLAPVQVTAPPQVSGPAKAPSLLDEMRSGAEVVSLGFSPKQDKIYYSEEFVHGLGVGPVAAVVAIENGVDLIHSRQTTLVFGDSNIFNNDPSSTPLPKMRVAALVNADRGTMRIGVKLESRTDFQSVTVRWWVFRSSVDMKESEELLLSDKVHVLISPSTVIVAPREQIRLTAIVEGSTSQDVNWSVVDAGGGQIEHNGLYTAPAKEGAYEIVAESVKFPDKRASSYIVVRVDEERAGADKTEKPAKEKEKEKEKESDK